MSDFSKKLEKTLSELNVPLWMKPAFCLEKDEVQEQNIPSLLLELELISNEKYNSLVDLAINEDYVPGFHDSGWALSYVSFPSRTEIFVKYYTPIGWVRGMNNLAKDLARESVRYKSY